MEETQQTQPVQEPMQEVVPQAMTTNYATFLSRFLAAVVDGVLFAVVSGILGGLLLGVLGDGAAGQVFKLILQLTFPAYSIFMVNKYGATLGKMALGIRVQNQVTGANLTLVEAFLREFVGKMLSGFVFFLGYLWVLWDPNKQGWHDKIAKSIVINTK